MKRSWREAFLSPVSLDWVEVLDPDSILRVLHFAQTRPLPQPRILVESRQDRADVARVKESLNGNILGPCAVDSKGGAASGTWACLGYPRFLNMAGAGVAPAVLGKPSTWLLCLGLRSFRGALRPRSR